MVEGGALVLASGGVCVAGDLSHFKKDKLHRLQRCECEIHCVVFQCATLYEEGKRIIECDEPYSNSTYNKMGITVFSLIRLSPLHPQL